MKMVPFLDVFTDVSSGNTKIPSGMMLKEGELPVVDQGSKMIAGYTNDLGAMVKCESPVIVFGDHTKILKLIHHKFAMGADGIKLLKPSTGLDASFAYHYLRSVKLPNAGYSRHYKFLKESLVPLPPLDEQRRIAAILNKADAIRQKRRQAIAHLDALAQSIFHDMFGSPLTNNKGFRTAPIRHVSRVVTGSSPSRKDPSNFGSSVEWIKTDNLSGEIATVASECLSETAKEKARLAPAGSILVCCIAGSRNSIGKASMTDRQVSFNQQINAIIPADEIDPIFLLWQLKSAPELVRRKSTDGMKGLVNKTQFEAIEILVPHISKQKAFRNIAETISNHKRAYIGFEHKSSTLFESLQSRAFRGEL